jgi:hypothetical protein
VPGGLLTSDTLQSPPLSLRMLMLPVLETTWSPGLRVVSLLMPT